MGEKIIYNYKLIYRKRRSPLCISLYFAILISGLLVSYIIPSSPIWLNILILISLYQFSYNIWGIWIIHLLNRKWRKPSLFIPWFGILPKNLLSFHEYLKLEISYLLFLLLSTIWISVWFSHIVNPFIYTYIITLFLFRLFLLLRILFINDRKVWIKYESYGISVYQTN